MSWSTSICFFCTLGIFLPLGQVFKFHERVGSLAGEGTYQFSWHLAGLCCPLQCGQKSSPLSVVALCLFSVLSILSTPFLVEASHSLHILVTCNVPLHLLSSYHASRLTEMALPPDRSPRGSSTLAIRWTCGPGSVLPGHPSSLFSHAREVPCANSAFTAWILPDTLFIQARICLP